MGRLEAFALGNRYKIFLDGIGNAIGYGIMIIVAFFRELFGAGTLWGFQVIPDFIYEEYGYVNNGFMYYLQWLLLLLV